MSEDGFLRKPLSDRELSFRAGAVVSFLAGAVASWIWGLPVGAVFLAFMATGMAALTALRLYRGRKR